MNWSFDNGWMLMWGLAAGIPLVLYLLRRRQVQTVTWPAMQFLRDSIASQPRRINLKHLILLLLRMSIPVLVGLCVATPLIRLSPQVGPGNAHRGRHHWILVFDTSLSMAYQTHTESVLDVARDQGLRLIDQAADRDAITIISAGAAEPAVLTQFSTNRQVEKQIVAALATQHGVLQLPPVLNLVDSMLTDHTQGTVQTHVVFLTDVAGKTWQDLELPEMQTRFESLFQLAFTSVVECGEPVRPNTAITQLTASAPRVTVGQTIELTAQVDGFGLAAPQTRQFELLVDGETLVSKTIVVPPDTSVFVSHSFRPPHPGEFVAQATVNEDHLLADNQRWLTVRAANEIRLACVEGSIGAGRSICAASSAFPQSSVPQIRCEIVPQAELTPSTLERVDCLCLCDVRPLAVEQTAAVKRFVDRGGCLIMYLGPNTQTSWCNQFFDALGGQFSPGSIRLESGAASGEFLFEPLDYAHPAIQVFQDHWQAGLIDAPIWRFYIAALDDDAVQRILNFDDGNPAIWTQSMGKGRIIVCTTPLGAANGQNRVETDRWNALDAWWSFVPLINELIVWGFGEANLNRNLLVGDWIEDEFDQTNFRQQSIVIAPSGETQTEDTQPGISGAAYLHVGPVTMPGVYQVTPVGAAADVRKFSINVDASESDLQRRSLRPIQTQLRQLTDAGDELPASDSGNRRRGLIICLGILLFALLTEIMLAHWFGAQGRPVT